MDVDDLALQELKRMTQNYLEQGVHPDEIMHELREDINYNIEIWWKEYQRSGMDEDFLFYARWLLADDLLESFISEKKYREIHLEYYSIDRYREDDPFLIILRRDPHDYGNLDIVF